LGLFVIFLFVPVRLAGIPDASGTDWFLIELTFFQPFVTISINNMQYQEESKPKMQDIK